MTVDPDGQSLIHSISFFCISVLMDDDAKGDKIHRLHLQTADEAFKCFQSRAGCVWMNLKNASWRVRLSSFPLPRINAIIRRRPNAAPYPPLPFIHLNPFPNASRRRYSRPLRTTISPVHRASYATVSGSRQRTGIILSVMLSKRAWLCLTEWRETRV